jgi:hypothetical protein
MTSPRSRLGLVVAIGAVGAGLLVASNPQWGSMPLPLFTTAVGALVVLLMLARILDIPILRNRRWPGTFASGTSRQRMQIRGSLFIGIGFFLLGLGEASGYHSKVLAGVLLVAAVAVFIVALVVYVRAGLLNA